MANGNIKVLAGGAALSIVALGALLVSHELDASFLTIDSRWLVVSGVPLLVALFAGGFVQRFKGFGIELESSLESAISRQGLIDPIDGIEITEISQPADAMTKGSTWDVYQLGDAERAGKRVLHLDMGGQTIYSSAAVGQYLQRLPNLSFYEVGNPTDGTVRILHTDAISFPRLDAFVDSVIQGNVDQHFSQEIVRSSLDGTETLLEAVKLFKESGDSELPVVQNGKIVGIVEKDAVFDALARAVLKRPE